jgi:hypothetical protein
MLPIAVAENIYAVLVSAAPPGELPDTGGFPMATTTRPWPARLDLRAPARTPTTTNLEWDTSAPPM